MSNFDEDLALAISLSLQEQQKNKSNSRNDPILIIDSSDDEVPIPSSSKKPPSRKAAISKPAPKSLSSKAVATSSRKLPVDLNDTIDLDTTIELDGEDTGTEDEDTATESESDEDHPATKPKTSPKAPSGSARRPPPSIQPLRERLLNNASPNPASNDKNTDPSVPLSPTAAFRAERAKMEQERIARLKRLRPDIVEKRSRDEIDESSDDTDKRPSKRPSPALTTSSTASNTKGKGKAALFTGSFGIPDRNGFFWHGAIRQTANKHTSPSQDTKPVFRLTEILPPPHANSSDPDNTLSFAIVSSYALELPWLYSLFSPDVPVILVAQPGQDGKAEVHHALPNWVRASPALAYGRGCMHVKSVWLQDVPLRTDPASVSASTQTAGGVSQTEGFGERLGYVLKCLNVAPALEAHLLDQRAAGDVRLPLRSIDELHTRWDWTYVTARLIPSIAGKHTGWPAVIRLGHVALMKAIRDMGAASDTVKIECQGSSIGSYSSAWTNEFMSSARGISPDKWLDTPKARRSKAPHPTAIRIVFPSLSTVDASVLGRPGGGTIFCQRRQWDASTFPKNLFVDSNSKRGKVLMHSKMILGLLGEDESDEAKPRGWLYVGSHNFTPSAWGNLSGTGFTPIMNITNYELGIVMSLGSVAEGDALACWKRPARAYAKGKDEPWMQNEHM
ncbi:hypothetical protein FRC09_006171 [Ceratobasidium sp. 395]|nr:hypothetical protein FRC09_006171 [Ceratobasidium sp. 395]